MKLNKERQKLYLDGKVGVINDGTVEQLREVTEDKDYLGSYTYYHKKSLWPSNAPSEFYNHHPIAWFYEETELPKKVRVDKANDGWYDTEIGNVFNVISEDDKTYFVKHPLNTEYLKHFIHKSDCTPINETNNELQKRVKYMGTEYDVVCETYPYYRLSCGVVKQSDCTPITESTPSSYKLNIDIPEWDLKAGTIGVKHKIYDNYLMFDTSMLPISLLPYIATPCTTFTLENGTQIELTENDIDKIKKL